MVPGKRFAVFCTPAFCGCDARLFRKGIFEYTRNVQSQGLGLVKYSGVD